MAENKNRSTTGDSARDYWEETRNKAQEAWDAAQEAGSTIASRLGEVRDEY